MRLDHALKSRFSELGGVLTGDKVTGGVIKNGHLKGVHTRNHESTLLEADAFVLASGSFFSGGLMSDSGGMHEPAFDLRMTYEKDRRNWASNLFFQHDSHAFLEFGVATDDHLQPFDAKGTPIENLYCAGAILAGYNPIREGSGGGVAISTGFMVADKIIETFEPTGVMEK